MSKLMCDSFSAALQANSAYLLWSQDMSYSTFSYMALYLSWFYLVCCALLTCSFEPTPTLNTSIYVVKINFNPVGAGLHRITT